MKKLFLALVFLALLVAASYYKATTQKERTQVAFRRGQEGASGQIEQYSAKLDSLADSVTRQEVEAAKLLWQRELTYRKGYDSLAELIEGKQSEVSSLTGELQQSRAREKTARALQTHTGPAPSKHELILSYYKKRYRTLPNDLSPYEKKVAVNEIRDETARKFSITLAQLDKIRVQNKLDY